MKIYLHMAGSFSNVFFYAFSKAYNLAYKDNYLNSNTKTTIFKIQDTVLYLVWSR